MKWTNVDYNHGNFFDGTYFTVPENGLYRFYAYCLQASSSTGYINLYLNGSEKIWVRRAESNSNNGFINIDTTLELVKNDKVDFRFQGELHNLTDTRTTYVEGRMIARLNV